MFGSLRLLFDHIREKGYFLHNGSDWPLHKQLCAFPINTFKLNHPDRRWILGPKVVGVEAGIMGFTRNVINTLVNPIYEAAGDLQNFIDDGTSSGGRGTGRHDQAIIGAQAYIEGLFIHQHIQRWNEAKPVPLDVQGTKHPFRIGYCNDPLAINFQGILTSRLQLPLFDHFCAHIRKTSPRDVALPKR